MDKTIQAPTATEESATEYDFLARCREKEVAVAGGIGTSFDQKACALGLRLENGVKELGNLGEVRSFGPGAGG